MIVQKLELENFRGFRKEEIIFNDRLNVFIGTNGAGKTSILEAVVKCLYKATNQLTNIFDSVDNIDYLGNNDLNYFATFCKVSSTLNFYTKKKRTLKFSLKYPKDFLDFVNHNSKEVNDIILLSW